PFRHGAGVNSLSLSRDGKRVVTAAADGMAHVWDLPNQHLLTMLAHPASVNIAKFAVDDQLVLTFCQDGSCRLWDPAQSNVLVELPKAPSSRVPPAISRDGGRVALPDGECSVRAWEIPSSRPLGGSLEMTKRITRISFGGNSNILAVACMDGSVGL